MLIHRSRYPDPVIPAVAFPDFVLESAALHGAKPALVDGLTGETLTYAGLSTAVEGAAATLARRGIAVGDYVGIMASNQPAWPVAFYAIMALGAAAVPLNPALTAREAAANLSLAGAATLISDDAAATRAGEVAAILPVATLGLVDLAVAATADKNHVGAAACAVDVERPAVIAFSSGTTGRPKGVMLSHRNLVATLCQHEGIYHVGDDDRLLATLPFFHIYGISIILGYALRHGATVVTMPRFAAARYLDLIEEHRVTWLHVAPPIVRLLALDDTATDFSSVRHVVSGGAPLDEAVSAAAERRIGRSIGQGYGMTEASPGVTWVPDDSSVDCPPGSVGVLVAGTEARLVDPATAHDSPDVGELWVRGPQVMRGYLNNPTATDTTVVEGGWLRTGDIARVDANGVWWIVDRLKELIKYNGYQVAPAELEAVLLAHPSVEDAAVAGVADEASGEIPKAWVVARDQLDPAALMAWVAERVAPYKKIRALEFVDVIPRSLSGKILRRELKARPTTHPGV